MKSKIRVKEFEMGTEGDYRIEIYGSKKVYESIDDLKEAAEVLTPYYIGSYGFDNPGGAFQRISTGERKNDWIVTLWGGYDI